MVTLNAQIRDLDTLLRKSPEQRTEDYYQWLLDEKKTATDEKKFPELAKKFMEMEGYKDTKTLATECEGLFFKIQYDRLVQAKSRASTESEYQDLAQKFKAMNGYGNTTELAKECDNSAVKAGYIQLVQAKNRASTEGEYQDLARKFKAMNGYENTTGLASECDNQYRVLKERREEQERIERERKAEQERIEQAERARRDAEQRRQLEIRQKERQARERRYKIGRGTSVFLAVLATIMIFFLNHFDVGWNIVLVIFLAGLNLIPFLVIFKADEYSKVKKGIFLCISIIVSMIIFGSYANYEPPDVANINTTALIISSVIFSICNITSCITAIVFPK